MMTFAEGARPLHGREVLVAEDLYLIASFLEDELRQLGANRVQLCPTLGAAKAAVDENRIDLALLDVNLWGESVFQLATDLEARNVPLIFVTGYSAEAFPDRWRSAPRLYKPVDREALATMAAALMD